MTVLKILTYALVSTWFLVSSWWEHVKRKMHPWWWEVKNKVAINSNFRIGAKISAQMHNRSSVLRNLSQICDIWQFSMNPHTPRVYEKLPNIPNIASVSQNRLTREKYFSLLWIFFWVFPKKMSCGLCRKIFFGDTLPKLKLVFWAWTRPSAFGMSDPIWGPLIHIFVDEKKNWEG